MNKICSIFSMWCWNNVARMTLYNSEMVRDTATVCIKHKYQTVGPGWAFRIRRYFVRRVFCRISHHFRVITSIHSARKAHIATTVCKTSQGVGGFSWRVESSIKQSKAQSWLRNTHRCKVLLQIPPFGRNLKGSFGDQGRSYGIHNLGELGEC